MKIKRVAVWLGYVGILIAAGAFFGSEGFFFTLSVMIYVAVSTALLMESTAKFLWEEEE